MNRYINEEVFLQHLKEDLNQRMQAAAEPLIQQALSQIEQQMREALATRLVAMIDTSFSLERFGPELRITILQKKEGSPFHD